MQPVEDEQLGEAQGEEVGVSEVLQDGQACRWHVPLENTKSDELTPFSGIRRLAGSLFLHELQSVDYYRTRLESQIG